MFRSLDKNAKERKNVAFFWKERLPNSDFPAAVRKKIAKLQKKNSK